MTSKRVADYHRIKGRMILLIPIVLAYYMYMVVPNAFEGFGDFVCMLVLAVAIFLLVCRRLGGWIFRDDKWMFARMLGSGLCVGTIGLSLLLGCSLWAGRLELPGAGVQIDDVPEGAFPLFSSFLLGLAFYGWKRQLPIYAKHDQTEQLKKELEYKVNCLELAMVEQEMSPHFIRNSLSTARALTTFSQENAYQVMSIMIDILGAYLECHRKSHVLLRDELAQIQRLVAMYEIGNEAPIYFKYEVDEEQLDTLEIPVMLLLNLVENCCMYGDLSSRDHPTLLRVTSDGEGMVSILIENPCNGHRLREISHTGKGLSQVGERLRLLNPGKNSVEVNATKSHFRVHIRMQATYAARAFA